MATINNWNSQVPVQVAMGGTGTNTLLNHGLLYGTGTTPIAAMAVPADGTLLTGVTGSLMVFDNQIADPWANFSFSSSTAGATLSLTASQTDDTDTASNASFKVSTGGASAGDCWYNIRLTAGQNYSLGIRNGDSDKFKITTGNSCAAGILCFIMTATGLITLANDLDVVSGGTGVGTFNSGVMYGNGSGDISVLTLLAVGATVIGDTGGVPVNAFLTAGTGITITKASGSLTVAGSGGGITWAVKGASTPLVVNNGFICTSGAALSFSLPAASVIGDHVALALDGSTSWTITQAANQQIRYGDQTTTLGVGGSLASTSVGDAVLLVCKANNLWDVKSSIGNLTVI